MLAELLGTSVQRIREWESGRAGIPRILPAALKGVETELRRVAKRRLKSLRDRANAAQRRRNRVRRNQAAFAAAAVVRKFQRDAANATFKAANTFIREQERIARNGFNSGRMLKAPKIGVGMMRKIRSDTGQRHRWRGRPGYALRPEDISDEE